MVALKKQMDCLATPASQGGVVQRSSREISDYHGLV